MAESTWQGRPLSELSREELIQAIHFLDKQRKGWPFVPGPQPAPPADFLHAGYFFAGMAGTIVKCDASCAVDPDVFSLYIRRADYALLRLDAAKGPHG